MMLNIGLLFLKKLIEHKSGCLLLLTTVAILSFSMIFENPLAFLDPILNGL